jgi:hypothetical protein
MIRFTNMTPLPSAPTSESLDRLQIPSAQLYNAGIAGICLGSLSLLNSLVLSQTSHFSPFSLSPSFFKGFFVGFGVLIDATSVAALVVGAGLAGGKGKPPVSQ